MESMNCQSCSAILLPVKTKSHQMVRCGSCGNTFPPELTGKAATEKTDRLAKWSFGLGLSSLLLCAFTGIPALILGIRSLRRMRFRTVKKREKFQAVTGTALGLVCGVIGGLLMLFIGGLAGVLFSTFEITNDKDRIHEMAAEVAEFDPIPNLEPVQGLFILNQKVIQYSDDPERKDSKLRLYMVELHMQPNDRQLDMMLKDRFLKNNSDYQLVDSGQFDDWEVMEGAKVTWEVFENKADPTEQITRYMALKDEQMSWLGVSLICLSSELDLDHEDAKKFFESLKPKILEN